LGAALLHFSPNYSLAQTVEDISELKPGQFTWHPERSPDGPVAIIVSLPDQKVYVYRNGTRIATSTCSTGKPGHETPTGVFTVLQQDKHHHSSTYNNAPMPNMDRLTWSGVALHAGNLPGYPASHGCVRLPLDFSALLFGITHVGTPVIIASNATQPADIVHPGMVLDNYAEEEFADVSKGLKGKTVLTASYQENKVPPVSVVISTADGTAVVIENGKTVAEGKAYLEGAAQPIGSHMFVLVGAHDQRQGLQWHEYAFAHDAGVSITSADETLMKRVSADDNVIDAIKTRMHPGLIMVMTDKPAPPSTRTEPGFVVMNQDPA
jgi:hypothetical protein